MRELADGMHRLRPLRAKDQTTVQNHRGCPLRYPRLAVERSSPGTYRPALAVQTAADRDRWSVVVRHAQLRNGTGAAGRTTVCLHPTRPKRRFRAETENFSWPVV